MRRRISGKRDGFTLVELLVVVAIIAILMAILLPTLASARASAHFAACASNLRQIGVGIHTYASEFGGHVPRSPEPLHPFDFQSNLMATNQLWIGDGPPPPAGHAREYIGLGALLTTTARQAELYFCPSDSNFNFGEELPRIGTGEDAYGSYLYRQLDHLPEGADRGLLDRLGANKVGDVEIAVEALAVDTNSLGPGEYYHANHNAERANVLFRDGSVRGFANRDNSLAIPPDAFLNPMFIPRAIDQLLSNADYAYHAGPPHQAPPLDSPP